MTHSLADLRRIAEAANEHTNRYDEYTRIVREYLEACPPHLVVALLDRIQELEAKCQA